MKRWLIYLLLLVQLLLSGLASAEAPLPPKPSAGSGIYVQDYAGIISAQHKEQMLQLGADLDRKTTAQLAVVTIKSLEGEALEEYSLRLLRSWGIGSKEKNNGALLLISLQDRKSRFEVGYGLEGVLPDGLTGRIQDEYMLPYFRKGDYSTGIYNGYVASASIIAKDAGVKLQAPKQAVQAPRPQKQENESSWTNILLIGLLIVLFLFDMFFLGGALTHNLLMLLFLFGGRGGGGGGGRGGGFGGGDGGGGGSSRSW